MSQTGLKNPGGAVRGVGASALAVFGIVLLLALLPLAKLGHAGAALWLCAGLAVISFVLCGLLRHAWAWPLGLIVPVALLAGGVLHWSLAALGILFGLTWIYVLYVRRAIYANKP